MWYPIRATLRFLEHLSFTDWSLVGVGVVVWGCFCMRGFGSRKHH
jgi:hypothetical protein